MAKSQNRTSAILTKHEDDLVSEWLKSLRGGASKDARISESQLRGQATEFISLLQQAFLSGGSDTNGAEWKAINSFLEELSKTRVAQGYTSDETARFIFSFKQPLFTRLRTELSRDPESLAEETWVATELLDRMGLATVRAFQKSAKRSSVASRRKCSSCRLPW